MVSAGAISASTLPVNLNRDTQFISYNASMLVHIVCQHLHWSFSPRHCRRQNSSTHLRRSAARCARLGEPGAEYWI